MVTKCHLNAALKPSIDEDLITIQRGKGEERRHQLRRDRLAAR